MCVPNNLQKSCPTQTDLKLSSTVKISKTLYRDTEANIAKWHQLKYFDRSFTVHGRPIMKYRTVVSIKKTDEALNIS